MHQNCLTVQTGLQGILYDGQGIEIGKKGAAPIRMFLPTKEKTLKNAESFFGGKSVIHGILLFVGGSGNLTPAKNKG